MTTTSFAALDVVEQGYRTILESLLGPDLTPGTVATPGRAARAWEELTSGYAVDVADLFTTFDADGYDQLISLGDIPFSSLCEHHLLPFSGYAHVVYLPSEKVVGVSKIARVVEAYALRIQIQERLTKEIADALWENLEPKGVMVMVEAHHLCMSLRGVKSDGFMRTSALRGSLYDEPLRSEAEWLIGRSRT